MSDRVGKCDVCGVEGGLTVCCSSMGAISLSYCARCLEEGFEPYGLCVAVGPLAAFHESARDMVVRSIAKAGKTIAEFDRDAAAFDDEYAAAATAFAALEGSTS